MIRANEDGTTFRLSFSSEEPYQRWLNASEVLSHADGAVDLSRLETIGCVLYNHDRDKVIGKIDRVWIEDGRGEAEISFDDDEFAQMIRAKVVGGSLKGVSVAYIVREYTEVKDGQTIDGVEGPAFIARKWEPVEISIVSVPADPTVGVGREQSEPEENTRLHLACRQFVINKLMLNL